MPLSTLGPCGRTAATPTDTSDCSRGWVALVASANTVAFSYSYNTRTTICAGHQGWHSSAALPLAADHTFGRLSGLRDGSFGSNGWHTHPGSGCRVHTTSFGPWFAGFIPNFHTSKNGLAYNYRQSSYKPASQQFLDITNDNLLGR